MFNDNVAPNPDRRQERHLRLEGERAITPEQQAHLDALSLAAERAFRRKWAARREQWEVVKVMRQRTAALDRNTAALDRLNATMRTWRDDA